jgi:hypothetical protein
VRTERSTCIITKMLRCQRYMMVYVKHGVVCAPSAHRGNTVAAGHVVLATKLLNTNIPPLLLFLVLHSLCCTHPTIQRLMA